MADTDSDRLRQLADYRMPFGKYKGRRLLELPEEYLLWFRNRGYPKGKLGDMMANALEIRANGLEYLFDPLRGK